MARLQAMIAEATADAHDEQEGIVGFFTMLEENIAFPFETVVLGVPVTVEGLRETSRDIAAIVARQAIPIEELPLPSPPPAGSEWIEAFTSGRASCRRAVHGGETSFQARGGTRTWK